MSKRRVRVLTAAVIFVGAIFAIRQFMPASDGFAAFRPVSASELAGRQEAHLHFPGSIVLHQSMQDMNGPLLSTGAPASVSTIAATSAPKDDVSAWYENQMRSRGWSPTCGETCVPTAPEWDRGNREIFGLYFLQSSSPDYRSTSLPTEYVVFYDLAARLGLDEMYCLAFRPPHYTGPPTGQHFLC
jgi:hypothetical protein